MHIRNSKLSEYKIKKIVRCFVNDLTALQSADILGLHRNTINRYYLLFREVLHEYQVWLFEELVHGQAEVDESYFGAKRVTWFRGKLKRWRGTQKQPVFGILERNGRVYTEIIPCCSKRVLKQIILWKVDVETEIISDGWRGYNGLVDMGFRRHYRVIHKENERSKGKGIHINGIENFWSFTKRRLAKFNGTKSNFELHLKECEWRYWKSKKEMYTQLITLISKYNF